MLSWLDEEELKAYGIPPKNPQDLAYFRKKCYLRDKSFNLYYGLNITPDDILLRVLRKNYKIYKA